MDLKDFFHTHNKIALGFSGGVDSSYLLYAAKKYGADVLPIFIKSQFQPNFELEDGYRLAADVAMEIKVVHCNILTNHHVTENLADRCYYCKQNIFTILAETARDAGYKEIMDGTNASDESGDRPGMRALREMNVFSPLQECGITKEQVRQLSREAKLFTWNKPAYACLATRVPTGQTITAEILKCVEGAENQLFDMGFTDFRVRVMGKTAKLQFPTTQMEQAFGQRERIYQGLKSYFEAVTLDLEGR